jgi:hypothetical protein
MSRSNPMHHEPLANAPKPPPWPFPPALLDYPLAAPLARPVRPEPFNPAGAEPAPF